MEALSLSQEYSQKLDAIIEEIQGSDELVAYLEEEEETDYKRLQEMYEPKITTIYDKVAANDPLQLIALEKKLLAPGFEGLFLPKILGYSVLRGEINEHFKYILPQTHFKDVLMAICNSSNFDIIRQRIGQSVQMGFALSSDIWITNLMNEVVNKKVRYFLKGMKIDDLRQLKERTIAHARYKRQFRTTEYRSTVFPENLSELKVLFTWVQDFLFNRIRLKRNNASLVPHLRKFISNESFQKTDEIVQILALYANFFDLEKDDLAHLNGVFNKVRQELPDFSEKYLAYLLELRNNNLDVDPAADNRVSAIVDRNIKDQLSEYYDLMEHIHSKGYTHEGAIEEVSIFYNKHEGRSLINECVRKTIFGYYERLLTNLELKEYPELFEVAKNYPIYMKIFSNQQFNQYVDDLSMAFIKKLLKKYTDKRGKDYQDIKKFVSSTFIDLGFLKKKEVVELFKTRRKRKKPVA